MKSQAVCSREMGGKSDNGGSRDVARLARAYYHADPQLIDETSVSGADGRWHYRDACLQRVADALTRAELTRVRAPQPAPGV